MILTADWHLTDTPLEAYRWKAFDHLLEFAEETGDKDVFILGDLGDRKDRHSAKLVNDMLEAFRGLLRAGLDVTLILGNHDAPLKGTPYWNVLNYMSKHLRFLIEPEIRDGILLLPFAENPTEAWRDFLSRSYKTVFLHQPVEGALLESGRRYEGAVVLPTFNVPYAWGGDIHTPQKIGQVRYVGAPHPVKFGDAYKTRMIRLDDKFKLVEEWPINGLARRVIEINNIEALKDLDTNSGDQIKVRFSIDANKIAAWPVEKEYIESWARERGLSVYAIEPHVALSKRQTGTRTALAASPVDILQNYGTKEGLSERILEVGNILLAKARSR